MFPQILHRLQQDCWFFSEQCDSCVASHTQESSDGVAFVVMVKCKGLAVRFINTPTDSARIVLLACKFLASRLVTTKQATMSAPAITTFSTITIR